MNLKRFGTKMEFIKKFNFFLSPAFEMLYFTSLAEQLIRISIILTYFEDINKRQQKTTKASCKKLSFFIQKFNKYMKKMKIF